VQEKLLEDHGEKANRDRHTRTPPPRETGRSGVYLH
jgi:hypothetical protein